jgi:hypothetical protein
MRVLAAFAAALLCLASATSPAPAAAAEEPEAVYARFHRAILAGSAEEMLQHADASQRARFARMKPEQKPAALKLQAAMMARQWQLRDKTLSPDGKAARLVVSGPGEGPGAPQVLYGVARMTLEGGNWKVVEANWSPDTPAMLSPATPGGAYAPPTAGRPAPAGASATAAKAVPPASTKAAPAVSAKAAPGAKPAPAPVAAPIVGSITGAPERKLGQAKPPCVFKPVMTAEDLENCK